MGSINIKDIARISGVGVSTVSRVLNHHPDVKDETRIKVLEVMKDNNYIPNNSARNLKRNASKSIGILVKGIHNPFFSHLVKSIEEKIDAKGYTMILHYNESNQQDNEAAIELIKEKRLKGLICLGGNYDNLHNDEMQNLHIPIVLASTSSDDLSDNSLFSSVNIDNTDAAFMAVDYICKLNHKNIGLITTGEGDKTVGKLRYEGYKKALSANDILFRREFVEIGGYTFNSGYEAMNRILDKNLEVTAVFVTSDIMAIGACKAILGRKLKIPENISVVGFDGIDYSLYFHPSITTIKQPIEKMGEKSIELLLELINNSKKKNEHIIFETKLEERESCKDLLRG